MVILPGLFKMKKTRGSISRYKFSKTFIVSQTLTFTAIDFDPFSNREIEKISRTTEPQKELWLSCILGGNDANLAYNESISLEFNGKFDLFAFNQAVQDLVRRHEALRST